MGLTAADLNAIAVFVFVMWAIAMLTMVWWRSWKL